MNCIIIFLIIAALGRDADGDAVARAHLNRRLRVSATPCLVTCSPCRRFSVRRYCPSLSGPPHRASPTRLSRTSRVCSPAFCRSLLSCLRIMSRRKLLCLVQHIHPEDEQRKVWQHDVQDHEQFVGDRVWQSRCHGDGDAQLPKVPRSRPARSRERSRRGCTPARRCSHLSEHNERKIGESMWSEAGGIE